MQILTIDHTVAAQARSYTAYTGQPQNPPGSWLPHLIWIRAVLLLMLLEMMRIAPTVIRTTWGLSLWKAALIILCVHVVTHILHLDTQSSEAP